MCVRAHVRTDICTCVTHVRTDGQTHGRTDGWTDGRTDGRTDRQTYNIYIYIHTYVYLAALWVVFFLKRRWFERTFFWLTLFLMNGVAIRALGLIICEVKVMPNTMLFVWGRASGDLVFEGTWEVVFSIKFIKMGP